MKIRKLLMMGVLLILAIGARGQVVTLDECQTMARDNYPSVARFSIIEQSKNYTLSNANRLICHNYRWRGGQRINPM